MIEAYSVPSLIVSLPFLIIILAGPVLMLFVQHWQRAAICALSLAGTSTGLLFLAVGEFEFPQFQFTLRLWLFSFVSFFCLFLLPFLCGMIIRRNRAREEENRQTTGFDL